MIYGHGPLNTMVTVEMLTFDDPFVF